MKITNITNPIAASGEDLFAESLVSALHHVRTTRDIAVGGWYGRAFNQTDTADFIHRVNAMWWRHYRRLWLTAMPLGRRKMTQATFLHSRWFFTPWYANSCVYEG